MGTKNSKTQRGITITVDNGDPNPNPNPNPITIDWCAGMNVQTAMEKAYDKTHALNGSAKFYFALEFYGKYGYYVIMIDGKDESTSEHTYWHLAVNGHSTLHGIDSTILNDGDVVEFKYETYNSDSHKGSSVEIKFLKNQKK